MARNVRLGALLLSAVLLTGLSFSATPAKANCYELIGCTYKDKFKKKDLMQLSCQILWEVRNTIYKQNGYCFKTPKAINFFGNAGCKYDNAADVPLNGVEAHNVNAIKKVEAKKGC
jgi:YARHG domain